MVPGSRSLGRRCLFFLLEGIQTLYLPSFQFVRQSPNEAQGGGGSRCSSHSTLVANSTLVPTASPIIGPASYSSTPVGRAPNCLRRIFFDVMRLAAWYVSGITYRSEEFIQGQPAMCSGHGVQGRKSSTQRLGNVFVAGVIENR